MNVFDLQAKIGLDTQGYTSGLKSAGTAMKKVGGTLNKGFKSMAKVGVASFAAVATASVALGKKIVDLSKETADYGDVIDKTSQRVGMSAESYQKWDYVLKINGAEMANMRIGLKTLTNQIGKANSGAKESQEYFKKLGISMEEVKNSTREEMFGKVIKGFQGMEDSTERAALANKMFGRSGQELAPLFNQSAKSTEELMKKAEDLGFVMSEKAVKASAKFKDSLTTLNRTFKGVKNKLAGEFLPSLTKITDGLALVFAGNDKGYKKIEKGIKGLLKKIGEKVPEFMKLAKTIVGSIGRVLIENMPEMLKLGVDLILSIINGIVESLPQVMESAHEVVTNLIDGLSENQEEITDGIKSLLGFLIDLIIENAPDMIEAGGEMISELIDSFSDDDSLEKIADGAVEIVTELGKQVIKSAPKLINAASKLLIKFIKKVTKPDKNGKTKLYNGFKKLFEDIDWKTMWEAVWRVISSAIELTVSISKDATQGVVKVLKNWWNSNIATEENGKIFAAQLWQVILDAITAIPAGIASGVTSGLEDTVAPNDVVKSGINKGENKKQTISKTRKYLEQHPADYTLQSWLGATPKTVTLSGSGDDTYDERGFKKNNYETLKVDKGYLVKAQEGVQSVFDFIANFDEFLADWLNPFVNGYDPVVAWDNNVGKSLGNDISKGVQEGIKEEAENYDSAVKEGITEPTKKAVADQFEIKSPSKVMRAYGAYIGQGLLLGISEPFRNVIDWLSKNVFQPLISGIKSIFGIASPSKKTKPLGMYIGQGLLMGVIEPFKNIADWLNKNIFEPFMKGIKDLFGIESPSTVMKGIGGYIIDGLLLGLSKKISEVKDKIKDVFGKVIKWAKDVFEQKSPSKVFAEIGKYNVLGLEKGFEDEIPNFHKMMADELGFDGGAFDSVMTIEKVDDPQLLYTQGLLEDIKTMLAGIDDDMVASIKDVRRQPLKVDSRTFGRAVRNVYA